MRRREAIVPVRTIQWDRRTGKTRPTLVELCEQGATASPSPAVVFVVVVVVDI